MAIERLRLKESQDRKVHWKRWGPYLSERAWGTVREDYSADGSAWEYFPHEQARSRAYRWNEDGIAGICDRHQVICFALSLWNGADPILKERLFGLTGSEGNHGEDVKEYYYYLDSTPTHSYMKYLYKYPHRAYPYADLVNTNRQRSKSEPEYELIDTGAFGESRYFDVLIEYAKATSEDMLIRINVTNHGPEAATIHLLPTLWLRNTWTWFGKEPPTRLTGESISSGGAVINCNHPEYGQRWLMCGGEPELLFTENETNNAKLFDAKDSGQYVKDGINDYMSTLAAPLSIPASPARKRRRTTPSRFRQAAR